MVLDKPCYLVQFNGILVPLRLKLLHGEVLDGLSIEQRVLEA